MGESAVPQLGKIDRPPPLHIIQGAAFMTLEMETNS